MANADEGAGTSEVTPPEAPIPRTRVGGWPRTSYRAAIAVAIVGLIVTGVLTWVSAENYSRNENRLLRLRSHDVAGALTTALPSIETALSSGAALADATGGNVAKFKKFIAPYVGPGRTFVSVSLWRVGGTDRTPVAVEGVQPELPRSTISPPEFFQHVGSSTKVSVIGFLSGPSPRLGFGFSGMTNGPFAIYGEDALPPSRYSPSEKNPAFNDLNYALYLGPNSRPSHLLLASVRKLPLPGRHSREKVAFGNTVLTLIVASRGPLTGSLPQRLPWIIAIGGILLTLGATALTVRLIERRRATERLADELEAAAEENRQLYAEQRGIAQTLQHALLPASLPQLAGLQISARYEAGAEGVEIGGDWYDVIELDEGRLLLVVGDVSGKGLPAATAMATLRFAIHAYASEGDEPSSFLPKLSGLVSVYEDRHLATILCAVIDTTARAVTITNAGHLPPLVIADGGSSYVETPVGLPVGIDRAAAYSSVTVSVPPGATFLAFTDGLVERRGESIEVGLERLRAEVSSNHVPLEQLLTRVVHDLRHDAPDDTAVAGIRWLS